MEGRLLLLPYDMDDKDNFLPSMFNQAQRENIFSMTSSWSPKRFQEYITLRWSPE